MSKYVTELPKDYFDIFDRNVKTIKIEFNEAIKSKKLDLSNLYFNL